MTDGAVPLVRRGRRNARFTAISNEIIDHPTLSPDARIALIYLLSKPDDWHLQINDLRRLLGTGAKACGRNKAYDVLRELKATAYVIPIEELLAGRFHRLTYYVFDEPHEDPQGFKAELRRAAGGQPQSIGVEPPSSVARPPHPEIWDAAQLPSANPYARIRETVASPCPQTPHPEKGDSTKNGKEPKTENPLPSPSAADRGDAVGNGGEVWFSELWSGWPQTKRPNNRTHAKRLFDELSPRNQHLAVFHAQAYRMMQKRRAGFEVMIPYLRQRLFREFDGAPQIDRDGYFVITSDREEWKAWLDFYRGRHSPRVIATTEKLGYVLTHTRWPDQAPAVRVVEDDPPQSAPQGGRAHHRPAVDRAESPDSPGASSPEILKVSLCRSNEANSPDAVSAGQPDPLENDLKVGAKASGDSDSPHGRPGRRRSAERLGQGIAKAPSLSDDLGADAEPSQPSDAADTTPAGGTDKPLKRRGK